MYVTFRVLCWKVKKFVLIDVFSSGTRRFISICYLQKKCKKITWVSGFVDGLLWKTRMSQTKWRCSSGTIHLECHMKHRHEQQLCCGQLCQVTGIHLRRQKRAENSSSTLDRQCWKTGGGGYGKHYKIVLASVCQNTRQHTVPSCNESSSLIQVQSSAFVGLGFGFRFTVSYQHHKK